MSEKRFTTKNIICSNYCVWDNNDKPYGNDDVVVLLNEQQDTITELKSIINFASNEGDLIVVLMKEIIKLRQEVQECRAYETIEKGVSNYD
ncbi:MAG: hypothetical protein IJI42_05505 [Methanobrevibacter sp.]|nr:hypothetical protein [Methanobrevibacter sp.]